MELNEAVNSEINSGILFSGMGSAEIDEMFGRATMNAKVGAIRKIAAGSVTKGRGTSREEFEKRLHLIDPKLRDSIVKGNMKLVDVELYVTKYVGGTTNIKMLKDDDKKVVGVSNVSMAKLEKDNIMLLDSIILTSGIGASNTSCEDVNFGIIPATLRNGEFYMKANGNEVIPSSSLEMFNTDNMQVRKGQFKLINPTLLQTQKAMEFYAEWITSQPVNTWMRLILKGTMAVPK